MKLNLFSTLTAVLMILSGASAAASEQAVLPEYPGQNDKCVVCGMFIAKYPDWTAEIIFKDGQILFFDGSKDLFKYYFNMNKYRPGTDKSAVLAIFVTEYYDVSFINALTAFYVIGSDVYGPMGRELIAFQDEADSKEFFKDHKGKQIIRFNEITPGLIDPLD